MLVVSARAVSLLACLTWCGVAHAADEARLKIDYDPPRLSVEAHGATLPQILTDIGAKVGFAVIESAGGSAAPMDVSIEKAPVDDVLRRLLRGENHTVVYGAGTGAGIDKIVLLGGPGVANSADRAPRPSLNAPSPAPVQSSVVAAPGAPPPEPATAPSPASQMDTAEATTPTDQPESASTLGNILKSHALSAVPTPQGDPEPSTTGAQPMTQDMLAETTRRAQQDLSALVEGLAAASRSLQNPATPAGQR
jgi:hypothetical protein